MSRFAQQCPRLLRRSVDVHGALVARNNLGAKCRKFHALRVPVHGNFRLLHEGLELCANFQGAAAQQDVTRRQLDIFAIEDKFTFNEDQIKSRKTDV